MNVKLLLLLSCGCLFKPVSDAGASAIPTGVSHAYITSVLSAEGDQSSAFPAGATVVVTTMLDSSAVDVSAEGEFGYYLDGLQSLTVHVPASGLLVRRGSGELSLGNDLDEVSGVLDYLIAYNFEPAVPDADLALSSVLSFRQMAPAGSVPTMLDSDAVPTEPLLTADPISFEFWNEGRSTRVALALAPQANLGHVVDEFAGRIVELAATGRLSEGTATSLVARFERSVATPTGGCGPLAGLLNQVAHLPRRTREDLAAADEIQAMARALAALVSPCPASPGR